MRRRTRRFILLVVLPLLLLTTPITCLVLLYRQADMMQPEVSVNLKSYRLSTDTDSVRICGNNSLVLNDYGLWEARISGNNLERGVVFGRMGEDLLYEQEKVFVDFIRGMIDSDSYLRFLRVMMEIFNGKMASYIPEGQREEIYGISLSCTHEFDIFGSPYERQMHYHAAHDAGHMMQQYMLVGCTSFAVKGGLSADGELLVGRNFDFYVGEDFARNKLVMFAEPEEGYRYVSVSWPGMTGVVSGMNEKGLTVTMNAAKGPIPTSSAMPVALLAKQILMEAATIDQAYEIAAGSTLFVSEALLIASAQDDRAVIIEKTPYDVAMYEPGGDRLVCANHFQSAYFADDKHNVENIANSDSRYRYERMCELVDAHAPVTPEKAAEILRDRFGKGGQDIGLANEKAVNQSIAHHSVIFKPQKLQIWVSTAPWQSGAYICYDLNEIFSQEGPASGTLAEEELIIEADSAFMASVYPRILQHRASAAILRRALDEGEEVEISFLEKFKNNNPEFYETYNLIGDYFLEHKLKEEAVENWKVALDKEIPRNDTRQEILKKVKKYDKR